MKTELVPFDLEKARTGRYELCTRAEVKIIDWHYFDVPTLERPLHCYIEGADHALSFRNAGEFSSYPDFPTERDIMMKVKKKKLYLAIFKIIKEGTYSCTKAMESKEELQKKLLAPHLYQIVEVEIEDDEQ